MGSSVDFQSFVSRDDQGNFQLQAEGLLSRKVGGWEGGRKSWYLSNIIGAITTALKITQKVKGEGKIYYVWRVDLINWANENKQALKDRYNVPDEKFIEKAISGVQAQKSEARQLRELEQGLTNWVNAVSDNAAKINRQSAQQLILDCYKNKRTTLELVGFYIEELPPEIGRLTSLVRLNISCHYLKTLPAEIGQLKNLKQLFLNGNSDLENLPPEIGQLTSLEELDINKCTSLKTIPPEIGQLKNLQNLNMSHTYTSNLKDVIGELTGLKKLNLTRAYIGDFSTICNMTSLEELSIEQADVREFPSEFGNLTNLKTFRFSHTVLYDSLPTSVSKDGSLQFETPEAFKAWFSDPEINKAKEEYARRLEEFKLELKSQLKIEGEVDPSSDSGKLFNRIVDAYKEKSPSLDLSSNKYDEFPSVITSMPHLRDLIINSEQHKNLPREIQNKLRVYIGFDLPE